MSEITTAIKAKQAQITQLQSDIGALQHAAAVLRGGSTPAKVTPSQPKAKRKIKQKRRKKRAAAKSSPGQPKTTQKRKRHVWSAAEKAAIGKRMKAYWAKRRKAGR